MIDELQSLIEASGKELINLKKTGRVGGQWVGSQYKGTADGIIHTLLINGLERISPDIPVVSEEDVLSWQNIQKPEYFIIDPIDGTASFAQGYSGFVTQIAYVKKGRVKYSVIKAPISGDLYWAEHGKGSFLNGERLSITDPLKWRTLIDNYPDPMGITSSAYHDLGLKHYIESGSISLKICKIADGTSDIFFKDILVRQWDIAPPSLILSLAGGTLRDIRGKFVSFHQLDYQGTIAANSELNAQKLIGWYNHRTS